MDKTIFIDFATNKENIESNSVREYKVPPVIISSQLDPVTTSNAYKDNIVSENSSNNPDEFRMMLNTLYPAFKSDLLCSIHESMIESGVHYHFEDVFNEYFNQNRHMTTQMLQRLLRESYTNVRIVKVILHIVSHYTYKEMGEDFIFPLSSLLEHENKAVRKFALKVFDNWDSVDTLSVLQVGPPMREKWLDNYKNQIIERLERKRDSVDLIFSYYSG